MEFVRETLLGYAKAFAAALPVFFSFLAILLVGWIIAKLVSKTIKKLLEKVNIGKVLDKVGINELADGKDLSTAIINVISKFIYYFIFLIFLSTAVESLGMQVLTDLIASLIEFFPKVLVSVIIFVIGFYLANLIKGIITSATRSVGMASGAIIANMIFYFILIMISVTAIEQMHIDASLITDNISILIGGIIIAGALAYGLSAVDVMGNILSVFFAKKTFAVGQYIRIGDVEGQIIAISSVNITIAQKGKRIIIPAKSFTKENVIISVSEIQEIEDGKNS
ncbi:MAG: hypothetical protein R2753_12770 [Chitinophagales bacterium]